MRSFDFHDFSEDDINSILDVLISINDFPQLVARRARKLRVTRKAFHASGHFLIDSAVDAYFIANGEGRSLTFEILDWLDTEEEVNCIEIRKQIIHEITERRGASPLEDRSYSYNGRPFFLLIASTYILRGFVRDAARRTTKEMAREFFNYQRQFYLSGTRKNDNFHQKTTSFGKRYSDMATYVSSIVEMNEGRAYQVVNCVNDRVIVRSFPQPGFLHVSDGMAA